MIAFRHAPRLAFLATVVAFLGFPRLAAQTRVWSGTTSSNWNVSTNWNGTFPNASAAIAEFGTSSRTTVSVNANITLSKLLFDATTSAYTITVASPRTLTLSGAGVQNLSGTTEALVINNGGNLALTNSATFSGPVTLNNKSGGNLNFYDTASAGNLRLTTASAGNFFAGSSTAGSATITINQGGSVNFMETSDAGSAAITANLGGSLGFYGTASAANATVVINDGGLDNSAFAGASVSLGSLATTGTLATLQLGSKNLSVGALNTSTTINAAISDGGFSGGAGGSLTKVGTGTLTLSGASTYTGGTTISAGTIDATSTTAFGTAGIGVSGSSATLHLASTTIANAVTLSSGGTLGGAGGVGALTVGSGGILSPGNSPGPLTAGNTTFASGGTFKFELNQAASAIGGTNYDLLAISGALTLTATSGNPFIIDLTSLKLLDNTAGAAASFDSAANYSFTFLTTTGGVTGFAADKFAVTTTHFENPFSGTWSVSSTNSGHDLTLSYTGPANAVPEPSTYALVTGLLTLAVVIVRRRSTAHRNRTPFRA